MCCHCTLIFQKSLFTGTLLVACMEGSQLLLQCMLHMQERRYIYIKQLLSIESYFSCMETIIKEEAGNHFDQNGFLMLISMVSGLIIHA